LFPIARAREKKMTDSRQTKSPVQIDGPVGPDGPSDSPLAAILESYRRVEVKNDTSSQPTRATEQIAAAADDSAKIPDPPPQRDGFVPELKRKDGQYYWNQRRADAADRAYFDYAARTRGMTREEAFGTHSGDAKE